jgi:iron complex transport system substrate-binding protein
LTRLVVLLLIALVGALRAEPRRIVSTAPNITEMLFALGLGDRVVGVTTYCTYPPEAQKLPKIGTYAKPNVEAILGVRPDLVIVSKTGVHSASLFAGTKLNVLEVKTESVMDIFSAMGNIGTAAGVGQRAAKLVTSLSAELAHIKRIAGSKPATSMMFLVGRSANSLENMIVVGRGSYLNELIATAGGRNVFDDAKVDYAKISLEQILARNPEVIIDLGDMAEPEKMTAAHQAKVVALWRKQPALKAVKAGRVHAVASSIYVVPGPRMVLAAREFARLLHPELFQ